MEKNENKNILTKDFWQGFYAGFTIIFISGFGGKIFFLNMIYASINDFCPGFWSVLAISEIMNLINISLGQLLKKYLSSLLLEYLAIVVFVLIGLWLIIKGLNMPDVKLIHNYEEERKLLINNKNNENNNNENEINKLNYIDSNYVQIIQNGEKNNYIQEEVGVFDSWWKYLIVYFLSSIGDKSQIASILITSKYNFLAIFNGTAIGIIFLVLISMFFGKTISNLLTNKQISYICGIFFLLYALIFFVDKILKKYM